MKKIIIYVVSFGLFLSYLTNCVCNDDPSVKKEQKQNQKKSVIVKKVTTIPYISIINKRQNIDYKSDEKSFLKNKSYQAFFATVSLPTKKGYFKNCSFTIKEINIKQQSNKKKRGSIILAIVFAEKKKFSKNLTKKMSGKLSNRKININIKSGKVSYILLNRRKIYTLSKKVVSFSILSQNAKFQLENLSFFDIKNQKIKPKFSIIDFTAAIRNIKPPIRESGGRPL